MANNLQTLRSAGNALITPTSQTSVEWLKKLKLEDRGSKSFSRSLERICERIEWLNTGSRKTFGVIPGQNVALLIDLSFDKETYVFTTFKTDLQEQLATAHCLYLLGVSNTLEKLWKRPRLISQQRLTESVEWVSKLETKVGCDFMRALRNLLRIGNTFHTILIILRSQPNHSAKGMSELLNQFLIGSDTVIHLVAYSSSRQSIQNFVDDLASSSGARVHCYELHDTEQAVVRYDTDLALLREELQKVEIELERIRHFKEINQSRTKNKIVTDDQVSFHQECLVHNKEVQLPTTQCCIPDVIHNKEVQFPTTQCHIPDVTCQNTQLLFLKDIEETLEGNLNTPFSSSLTSRDITFIIEKDLDQTVETSEKWLLKYNLKALGMDLYQILNPESYSVVQGYVPALGKHIRAGIHERALVTVNWYDNSTRYVHVDAPLIQLYTSLLSKIAGFYDKRLKWLTSGSRRFIGTVVESNVIFVVQAGAVAKPLWNFLMDNISRVLQEQLTSRHSFNVVQYGGKVLHWSSDMRSADRQATRQACDWLRCHDSLEGSNNVLEMLRSVFERKKHYVLNSGDTGIYFVNTSIPDQPLEVVIDYLQQCCLGTNISVHTALIQVRNENAEPIISCGRSCGMTETANYIREVARAGHGRFHWVHTRGYIEESDDITKIQKEQAKIVCYTKRCEQLLQDVQNKYKNPT
ncbi:von Willebrand factor A domain-containing protein 3A-like isoform X2 [Tachypleus tridentatus]|uniref:von Willebrand factor A domain-containing protein 3A-like isoform X2 n=1 Tax=Tachypleus tridentatus TaxID=6853 RepID=UPI003FD40CF9